VNNVQYAMSNRFVSTAVAHHRLQPSNTKGQTEMFGKRYEIKRSYYANGYSEYVVTYTWYGRYLGINRRRFHHYTH